MNEKNTESIVIPIVMDKNYLWSNVFGSWNGAFPWWVSIEYFGDTDWDTYGAVKITYLVDVDNSEETASKILRVEDIADAYASVVANQYHHCGETVNIDRMDECASDLVLQQAVFGDVIYG